jgi:hypothetical protein
MFPQLHDDTPNRIMLESGSQEEPGSTLLQVWKLMPNPMHVPDFTNIYAITCQLKSYKH